MKLIVRTAVACAPDWNRAKRKNPSQVDDSPGWLVGHVRERVDCEGLVPPDIESVKDKHALDAREIHSIR